MIFFELKTAQKFSGHKRVTNKGGGVHRDFLLTRLSGSLTRGYFSEQPPDLE